MEYHLEINNQPVTVEADAVSEDSMTAEINGKYYDVQQTLIDPNRMYLRIAGDDDISYIEAFAVDTASGKVIIIDGIPYTVKDLDAVSCRQVRKRSDSDAPESVTPPMPAVVISILVTPGDTVEKGQNVIVVSAMKMETTLTAPFAGEVVAVNTSEGAKVAPGDILIDIMKNSEEEAA